MTYTYRNETFNGYTVSMKLDKFDNFYTIYIYTPHGTTYRKSKPQIGWKRATATYNRYRREVKAMAWD